MKVASSRSSSSTYRVLSVHEYGMAVRSATFDSIRMVSVEDLLCLSRGREAYFAVCSLRVGASRDDPVARTNCIRRSSIEKSNEKDHQLGRCLGSKQTRLIRFCLVWAAEAKVKAAAQRETHPRPGHPPHPRSALLPSTESLGVTTQCEQGGARSPGHQSCRVEIGSRAYPSAPRGEVSRLLRWAFSGRLASALDGFAVDVAHRGRGPREGGPARRLRRTRIPTRRHSRRSRAERRLRTR